MTSAGVMMAKVIWNMKNTVSGMVPVTASRVTPSRNALSRLPMKRLRRAAVGERQRVAHGQPQQRDDAGDGEALHEDGEHVLGAHQAGVEQRETGQGHEQHQRRGGDDPGGVAGVGDRQRRQPRPAQMKITGTAASRAPPAPG